MQTRKPARRTHAWWLDERGDVAVSYLILVVFALAIALAVVTLRSPIRTASKLAASCLAENNP